MNHLIGCAGAMQPSLVVPSQHARLTSTLMSRYLISFYNALCQALPGVQFEPSFRDVCDPYVVRCSIGTTTDLGFARVVAHAFTRCSTMHID